jgi:hypothetical protein
MNDAATNALITVMATILLDWVLGVLVSIKNNPKTFSLNKLPQTLARNIFPYMGGLLIVWAISIYIPFFEKVFFTFAGLASLKFSKEALIEKGKELFK